MMDYRFLGSTGLRVSSLSLGSMTFGGSGGAFFEGVGSVDERDVARFVHEAIDFGVNLIDTADVYSRGRSEELLGQVLRERRGELIVATKAHGRMSDAPNQIGQSWSNLVEACDASLRRLGTDYIDVLTLHGFDSHTDLSRVAKSLDRLVSSGKVRYIACSNFSAWQTMKFLAASDLIGADRFCSYQGNYNLVAREAEWEILPMCEAERLGFVAWSPLAGGLLTGKYKSGDFTRGRLGRLPAQGAITPQSWLVADSLREVAAEIGATPSQVALRWLLGRPGVSSVLLGARTLTQLRENLRAIDLELPTELLGRLDNASATALPYPYWHQRQHNHRRIGVLRWD